MKQAHKFIFSFSLILLSFQLYSATENSVNFTKTVANRFSKLWFIAPQEKVYLHTDKPYYSAGESIWFKGYLVNASTHYPTTKSQFIYVELIDKSDSIISRVKIKKDSLGFSGFLKLDPEIHTGNYGLRAYTYWMQNAPADFFYSKNIYIGNNIDDRVLCNAVYGTPVNGHVPVSLTFTNAYKSPYKEKNVVVKQSWMRTNKSKIALITDNKGKIQFSVAQDSLNSIKRYFDVAIKEPGLKFKNKIYIPDFTNDFDLQFFPESGLFFNDNLQTIGFKAIGTDGLSVEVTGTIFNNLNEEISEFSSYVNGMGKLSIKTNPNEAYYALVKSSSGVEKRVNLPLTTASGIGIHLGFNRGKILYEVNNFTQYSSDSLYLLVHSRGVVYIVLPLINLSGQLPETLLPAGITSFSVIDSLGNTYCERLYFNRNFTMPVVTMQTSKFKYDKREPIVLNFNVKSSTDKPLNGSFSISVTDSKSVLYDSLSQNINNYLLLSSDLKGYIESSGLYFADNSMLTREKTDILMLTQGWKRFNTADFVKGKYKQSEFYLEAGQTISGEVRNLLNKPSKNTDIIMFSAYKNKIALAKTDSLGKFVIEGFEFPDSTNIVVKAKSKNKIVDVELITDKEVYPKSNLIIPNLISTKTDLFNDYFNLSKEKYFNEGGMRVINLDEFEVRGAAIKPENANSMYSQLADNVLNAERLEDFQGLGVLDILGSIPGIQVNGQEISIRGAGGNPLFVVDGFETENIDDILYLSTSDIEEISVFKGVSASIFGSRGGNGVIAIALKKGFTRKVLEPSSLAHLKPLGFQKPVDFYVPQYEVDSVLKNTKLDLRTTIYWNPRIQTDVNGFFDVTFYTADKANDYTVVMEGISKTGEICRFVGIIKREDK